MSYSSYNAHINKRSINFDLLNIEGKQEAKKKERKKREREKNLFEKMYINEINHRDTSVDRRRNIFLPRSGGVLLR